MTSVEFKVGKHNATNVCDYKYKIKHISSYETDYIDFNMSELSHQRLPYKNEMLILSKFIKQDSNIIEINSEIGCSTIILSKLINLIYILDYCSIYKAILTETDPTPVKSINFIKNKLS